MPIGKVFVNKKRTLLLSFVLQIHVERNTYFLFLCALLEMLLSVLIHVDAYNVGLGLSYAQRGSRQYARQDLSIVTDIIVQNFTYNHIVTRSPSNKAMDIHHCYCHTRHVPCTWNCSQPPALSYRPYLHLRLIILLYKKSITSRTNRIKD